MSDYASHPQYAFDLIKLINDYRASKGVQPLIIDHTLMDLSQNYTEYLDSIGLISHTADGQYPWDRIAEFGFVHEAGLTGSKVGNENLHFGYSSRDGYDDPQGALQGWIDSSGHNRNMLNPEWDRVGIGYKDGLYTANFGDGPDRPTGGTPPTKPAPPAPEPTPPEGSFGPLRAVTYEVEDEGRLADYATIRLGNVVDRNGSIASIRFEALDDGKVVARGYAGVPEPGATLKLDPARGFDAVRVSSGEFGRHGCRARRRLVLAERSGALRTLRTGTDRRLRTPGHRTDQCRARRTGSRTAGLERGAERGG